MNKELTTIKELIAEMKAQFSKSVDKFDSAVLMFDSWDDFFVGSSSLESLLIFLL